MGTIALLKATMACVALATGLPDTDTLPGLGFMSPETLAAAGAPHGGYLPMHGSGVIMLPHGWSPSDRFDLYVLAHEVTHHLQVMAGADTSEEQANTAADACLEPLLTKRQP